VEVLAESSDSGPIYFSARRRTLRLTHRFDVAGISPGADGTPECVT